MASRAMLSLIGEEPDASHRRTQRFRALLVAKLVTTSDEHNVKLRDISARGALVEGDKIPSSGTDLLLRRGSLEVFATVVWNRDGRAGLEFDEPLSESELWAHINAPALRASVSGLELIHRRPGFRGDQLKAEERALERARALREGHDAGGPANRNVSRFGSRPLGSGV